MSDETLSMIDAQIAIAQADLAKVPIVQKQIDDAKDELRMAQDANQPRRVQQLQERLRLLETDYQRCSVSARARLAQHQALREQYLQR
jgi:hypothetical protein